MSGSDALVQARTILDDTTISTEDRLTFLGGLTKVVIGESAKLPVGGDQRIPWARSLVAVAGFLLGPPPPETPPAKSSSDEEQEFELTQSEFEIWEANRAAAAAAEVPVEEEEEEPGPDAPVADDEAPEAEEDKEDDEAPPAATDDFEDFVIDEVIVEE